MKLRDFTQKLTITLVLCFVLHSANLLAQNIGINTDGSAPDNSALLDISSDNAGLLIPRVSLASLTDGTTIASPANSLLVFNTNALVGLGKGYYYNDGTSGSPEWVPFLNKNNAWLTTGNTGTSPDTDFLGTIDAQGLVIKTDATERMRFSADGGISDPTVSITSLAETSSALDIVANSLTEGSILTLRSSSTEGFTEGFGYGIVVDKSGANSNYGYTSTGIGAFVTNSGLGSKNVGGEFVVVNSLNEVGMNLQMEGVNSGDEQQLTGHFVYLEANGNSNSSSTSRGIQIQSFGSASNFGIDISLTGASSQSYGVNVSNVASGTLPGFGIKSNISGALSSSTTDKNYAGFFSNSSTSSLSTSVNYGIRCESIGATTSTGVNCGGFFSATGAQDGKNYALIVPHYNSSEHWGGWVGIGTITPKRLLHVDGTVRLGGEHFMGRLEFVRTGTSNPTIIIAGANTSIIKYILPTNQATVGQVLQCASLVADTATLAWGTTSASQWNLAGNSGTNPGTDFIGNTDLKDLYFKTNNIERMRIISGGNVGITNGNLGVGTISPSSLLHVEGNAQIGTASSVTGELKFYNSGSSYYTALKANPSANASYFLPAADGTAGQILKTDGSGNMSWVSTGTIATGGTGTTSSPTQYGVIYASATTSYASTAAGTAGQVLTSNATSAPTWQSPITASYYNDVLSGDVTLTNANQYYDVLTRSLSAGTWHITAQITIGKAAGTADIVSAKLFESGGPTNYASAEAHNPTTNPHATTLTMTTIITLASTTTVRLAAASTAASGLAKAALISNAAGNTATIMTCVKIAP